MGSRPAPSGRRGSNSRPQPWQGCALPTELRPPASGPGFPCSKCVRTLADALRATNLRDTWGVSAARWKDARVRAWVNGRLLEDPSGPAVAVSDHGLTV